MRQVQQREELDQIYPYHPSINPISAKIIEQKNSLNPNTSMATSMTNANTKKFKKAEEYQREKDDELRFNPQINQSSRDMGRGLNALMQDTNRRLG